MGLNLGTGSCVVVEAGTGTSIDRLTDVSKEPLRSLFPHDGYGALDCVVLKEDVSIIAEGFHSHIFLLQV